MARRGVRTTVVAQESVARTFDHLADVASVATALRFLDRVQVSYARILRSPRLGKVQTFAQVRLEGVRAWPVLGFRNWLVYYRETATGIDVLDVLHGARDQQARLRDGLRGFPGDADSSAESD